MNKPDRYLTVPEVMDLTRAPKATVYDWHARGKLRGFKPGRRLLFRESDVRRFVEGDAYRDTTNERPGAAG